MTLQILAACISPREPPREVKSWEKAKTGRPSTRPWPVITPSDGISIFSMPKLSQRCCTNISSSRKLPGSKSRSSLSRAVSLPPRFCLSTALAPPISLIFFSLSSSFWIASLVESIVSSPLQVYWMYRLWNTNKIQSFFHYCAMPNFVKKKQFGQRVTAPWLRSCSKSISSYFARIVTTGSFSRMKAKARIIRGSNSGFVTHEVQRAQASGGYLQPEKAL